MDFSFQSGTSFRESVIHPQQPTLRFKSHTESVTDADRIKNGGLIHLGDRPQIGEYEEL